MICSSAGNHAQGVALGGGRPRHQSRSGAWPRTPRHRKIAATRAYGAEVVLHGTDLGRGQRKSQAACARSAGYTYIHPFDDEQLIAGQGTLGLEVYEDWPEIDIAVVPIGGGGLISGVSMALKSCNPKIKIIGVESSDGPGMKRSIEAGPWSRSDRIDCIIDGLRVKRVGREQLLDRAALCGRHCDAARQRDLRRDDLDHVALQAGGGRRGRGAGGRAVARAGQSTFGLESGGVLSGGNVNLDQLKGLKWN